MDAVERQVEAYNAGDVEAFVACYADDAVIEDADGQVEMSGRAEMRKAYGDLFERNPDLRGEIVSRIRVGAYVVDEERITGYSGGDLHAVAIYRLDDEGLIDRVRLLL
jgi:hypothetical protein